MVSVRSSARRLVQSGIKSASAAVDRVIPPARGGVVLIYHRVGRTSQLEVDLPTAVFDEQMAALAEVGRACTLDTMLQTLAGPATSHIDPVVVTFDDGTRDFVDHALPVLVRYQIPAVLYVATDFIESQRSFPDDGHPVSWAGLRDAVSTGLVTVGSHTHTHALLDRLTPEAAANELDQSIDLIRERIGVTPRHFAYPKALAGNAEAAAAVRRRFASAAIAGTRPNPYERTDPYQLLRSPVQVADGMRWFRHKLAGGMRAEDDLRRVANRVRYAGATQ